MENVLLIIHLILAVCLIGIVLLQRSEGGGLGLGGGGGGVVTGRQAATALGKLTWVFAAAFLATSITLTILAARNASAFDPVLAPLSDGAETPAVNDGADAPPASDLLPPPSTDAPALPPRTE